MDFCRRAAAAAVAASLSLGLHVARASAGQIAFDQITDTIEVSGQTVIGAASTYEAVVKFPSGSGAFGYLFSEHQAFFEDKLLEAGPDQLFAFDYDVVACCISATPLGLAPDVFHHVAYVYDGAGLEERLYADGALVGSRAAPNGDVSDGDGLAHIGARERDGAIAGSFIGDLDSVRVSDIARYSGASFTPPTGDMTSDAHTLLLYNFDEPRGSTTIVDSGPLGRDGTVAQGFATATAPLAGADLPPPLDHFLCYKTKSSKGSICSASSAVNAGAACSTEADCGGNEATSFCVPNKLPKGIQATLGEITDGDVGTLVDVKKGLALCNPANKNGEGIADPDDHLRSFGIAVAKTGEPQPPFPPLSGAIVSNQFGTLALDAGKVDRLLVPAAKSLDTPVAPPEAPAINHFRCAKVKVSKGTPRFEPILGVTVEDQFAQPKQYDLKKPSRLCTPVQKNLEPFIGSADVLLCYGAKPAKGQPKHVRVLGLHVAHQFALELLDTVKEEELCVPSQLAAG